MYMGFEFNIKGAAHFGWARFSSPLTGPITLTGYAYETVSLKPIVTGDTGSGDSSDDETSQTVPAEETVTPTLGVLARGAAGLAMRRDLN